VVEFDESRRIIAVPMTIDNVQALTCVGVEEMETVSIGCSIGFNRESTSGKEG
jgi:hypothetical protein